MAAVEKDPYYGALQEVVDQLFDETLSPVATYDEDGLAQVRRLDVVLAAEWADLPEDLQEVVRRLPPGTYNRVSLCVALNSIIGGHGWGLRYGTVS